jgi:hypothetical protein
MARRFFARLSLENCMIERSEQLCSKRQIRYGLFAINLLTWALILAAFNFLI